jgi:beta-lactamase regulating signal transducer with metallopeptidase domain
MFTSLLLAGVMWLRGRTPRSPSQPLTVVSGLAVLANEGISTAGLVGCWRPAVWVNPYYWAQLSDNERELALAHERAHLLRHDNLKKLLLQFLAAMYAVLPFSRAWVKQYELDCELAVDDHCRERLDEHAYKNLLARSTQFALAGHAVASGMSQADLEARLRHLHGPRWPRSRWHGLGAGLSVGVALLPIGLLLSHSVTRCLLACYLGY